MKMKLTLCSGAKCCPTVEVSNGMFILKDDFGGKVSLMPDQLKILVESYPKLQKEINH